MKSKLLVCLTAGCGLMVSACGFEKHSPWKKSDGRDLRLGPDWDLHQESPKKTLPQVDAAPDCGVVEAYVKQRLVLEMESSIRTNLRWMIEDNYYDGGVPEGGPSTQPLPAAAPASDSATQGAPESFTDTNNQIEGVEEPDTLKTDGTYFYHLTANQLRISKVWPVTALTAVAVHTFDKQPQQMLLTTDKKLVVFLSSQLQDDQVASFSKLNEQSFLPRYEEKTMVMTFDVSDPSHPRVVATKTLAGTLNGARRVGDKIRLVLSRSLGLPREVNMDLYSELQGKTKFEKLALVEHAIERNKLIINSKSFSDLVHSSRTGLALTQPECKTMLMPRMSTPLGITDIYSSDLTTGEEAVVSLLSRTDGIHGAKDALYVSTQYHWWDVESRDTNYFYVHKFSYDGIEASFRGTAGMEGNILNQYSMDEFEGNFRVAATVRQKSDASTWDDLVFNRVYVVKEYDGFLAVAGISEPLAKDEQIYGVRFAGKNGYVVTFRRTDPLFVIGFDDPIKPVILGELKIPGYSTYLHPIANGQLLAVGEEIDEFSQMTIGNKISVYDVSNPAQPIEKFKKVLAPDLYIDSVYNHKSFKYHAATNMLALPSFGGYVALESGGASAAAENLAPISEYSYGISLYRVDQVAGIVDAGFLNMSARGQSDPQYGYAGSLHAVVADDYVYGVDSRGIKTARVADPSSQYWELPY